MKIESGVSKEDLRPLRADEHVNEGGATRILALSKFTLRNYRHLHKGPPYVRIGRAIRYRVGDLLDFMAAHRIDPTKKAA
jgi:hypothetical protein